MYCLFFSRGNSPETRGTAFVVYEDIFDAKNACDHLSGFNVCGRYLVVLYYQVSSIIVLVIIFQRYNPMILNGPTHSKYINDKRQITVFK